MTDKENSKITQNLENKNELESYKEIVAFAHQQISFVKTYYIWAFVTFGIVFGILGYFVGKDYFETKENIRREINLEKELVMKEIKIHIDKQLDERKVNEVIQEELEFRIDQLTDSEIMKRINAEIEKIELVRFANFSDKTRRVFTSIARNQVISLQEYSASQDVQLADLQRKVAELEDAGWVIKINDEASITAEGEKAYSIIATFYYARWGGGK